MKKLQLYLLLAMSLLVFGCSCGCDTIDTSIPTGYTTATSTVTVFADGCSASDGSVDNNGIPTGSCDGVNQYVNRGRWVKSPNTGVSPGSTLSINVEGSIYYCSTGYDNKNPSPNFIVTPGHSKTTSFVDNSQMAVSPGQIIVLTVAETSLDPGITLTNSCNAVNTCTTTSTTPNEGGVDSSQNVCITTAQCDSQGNNCGAASNSQCTITDPHYPCTYGSPACIASSSTSYTTTETCTTTTVTIVGFLHKTKKICTTTAQCDSQGNNCGSFSDQTCSSSTTSCGFICPGGSISSNCTYTQNGTTITTTPNPSGVDSYKTVCTNVAQCGSDVSSCGTPSTSNCTITDSNYPCTLGPAACISTSNTNCSLSTCNVPTNTCATYSGLTAGTCAGKQGFGLSIYVGNTEIVTLDRLNQPNAAYYPYAQHRDPYLFAYLDPNIRSSFFTDTAANHNFNMDFSNYGQGQYMFMVPDGVSGILGFAIAQGQSASRPTGQYTLQVMSTAPACFVNQAQAFNQPDQRGALQVLISGTNPNDVDNVLANFDSLNGGNEISVYYPELNQYIASIAGVTISNNSSALSALVTPSAPSLSPMIQSAPGYVGITDSSGDIWYKVRDDYYHDNVGEYEVITTVTTKVVGPASQFLNELITPITTALSTASQGLYQNFTYAHYLHIVKLCLLLYIIIYGAEFALGLTTISSHDILFRILKIAVIVELFQPDSWSFFNKYLFQLFISGRDWLIAAVTGDPTTNKIGIFGFVDDIFNVFFSPGTWIKIAALFPYGIGVLFLIVIIGVMVLYLVTLARVIISYLLIVVGISILIALAPIFLVLLLFKHTKKYFDNWIKHLVDYALQPVIMFAALFIMNIIFMEIWNSAMDFTVCFGKVIDVYFPLKSWTNGFLPNVQLGCIQSYITTAVPNFLTMLVQLMSLVIMTLAIQGMIGHIPQVTSAITGAATAGSIAKTGDGIFKQGMDFAQSTIKTVAKEGKKMANRVSNTLRGNKSPSGAIAKMAMKPAETQQNQPKPSGKNAPAAGGINSPKQAISIARTALKEGPETKDSGGKK